MWAGAQAHLPALARLQQQRINGQPIYFSKFLRIEFLQALVSVANDPGRLPQSTRRTYKLHRWGDLPDARRIWFDHGLIALEEFLFSFEAFIEVDFDSQMTTTASKLMAEYQLKSYDALHLATALSINATDFVTADADFLKLPEDVGLTVHLLR